jgi:hypothetical protein
MNKRQFQELKKALSGEKFTQRDKKKLAAKLKAEYSKIIRETK